MDEEFCMMCKNHCPLSNPKCAAVSSPEMAARREAGRDRDANTCKMCDKHCPLDELGCSLGKTILGIKSAGKITR